MLLMGKTGCLGVVVVVLIGLPLAFVPLLIGVFLSDRDRYGEAPTSATRRAPPSPSGPAPPAGCRR